MGTGKPLTFFYSVCSLPVAGDVSIGVAGSKPLDSQAPVRDPTYGQVLGTGGNCGKKEKSENHGLIFCRNEEEDVKGKVVIKNLKPLSVEKGRAVLYSDLFKNSSHTKKSVARYLSEFTAYSVRSL